MHWLPLFCVRSATNVKHIHRSAMDVFLIYFHAMGAYVPPVNLTPAFDVLAVFLECFGQVVGPIFIEQEDLGTLDQSDQEAGSGHGAPEYDGQDDQGHYDQSKKYFSPRWHMYPPPKFHS